MIKVVLVPAYVVGLLTGREAVELEIGGMMIEMGQTEVVMLDPSSGPVFNAVLDQYLPLSEKRIP